MNFHTFGINLKKYETFFLLMVLTIRATSENENLGC